MDERIAKFVSSAKNLPNYSGWSDEDVVKNVTDVLNSGDYNRIQRFSSALSGMPEFGGFSSDEIQSNLIDVFKPVGVGATKAPTSQSQIKAQTLQSTYAKPFESLAKKFAPESGIAQNVAQYFDAPMMIPNLISSGTQRLAQSVTAPDQTTGALERLYGSAQIGLGALGTSSAAVPMTAFNLARTAIGQISPEAGRAVDVISNPVTSLLQPQTRAGQSASGLADIAAQALMFNAAKNPKEFAATPRQIVADALSQSAYKIPPSIKQGKRYDILRTAQQYDVTPTAKGVAKIDAKVSELKTVAEQLESVASATQEGGVKVSDIVGSIDPLIEKWSKSDTPQSFIKVLENYKNKVLQQNKSELGIQDLVDLKRNLQSQLSDVYEKQMKINPSIRQNILKDAKSAIEQDVRAKLETMIPEYADVNSKIHKLLKLRPYVEQAASRISNKDLATFKLSDVMLGGSIGYATGEFGSGFGAAIVGKILTDPRVQSYIGNKISPQRMPSLSPKAGTVGNPPAFSGTWKQGYNQQQTREQIPSQQYPLIKR